MSRIVTFFIMILLFFNLGIGILGWVLPVGTAGCDGGFHNGFGRCEQGSQTITLTSSNNPGKAQILFSTPFTNPPSLTVTPETGSTLSGLPASVPYSSVYFQSGNIQTWANMPKTNPGNPSPNEVYGDTLGQHEATIDGTGAFQYRFGIDCSTSSSNSTAVLWVQFSTDLSTWNNLTGATGNGDDIGISACSAGPMYHPGNGVSNSALYFGMASSCSSASLCYLRVVGSGGSGAGDSPQFSSMWIEVEKSNPVPAQNIWNVAACLKLTLLGPCNSAGTIRFQITVTASYTPGGSVSIVIDWVAYSSIG